MIYQPSISCQQSEEAQESHILKEEDSMIYTHLEKVLINMIDAQIFKSCNDYVQNKRKYLQYLKYAEKWQSALVICSYTAFLYDILLIVTFIAFFLKYCKTMQAMLEAFITMNMSGIWAHYTSTGYYPISIRLSQQIPKENVHITTSWCCFKTMHRDWDNTIVTGISGTKIDMPSNAKGSIFTDNDLTHINDDHFEINLVARLLNQIYVVPVLPPGYNYNNSHANVMDEPNPSTSASATTSAPPFSFTA